MSRVGVFGGSFNPIHLGHTGIVKRMIKAYELSRVVVIPTFNTPLKDNTPMLSPMHRFRMCELAFEDIENVTISSIEIEREGKSYTVDTLKELKRVYPDDELFLIIGADSFLQLRLWRDVSTIFKLTSILTVVRGEVFLKELISCKEFYEKEFDAKIFILEEPICSISSTEVRNSILNNKPFIHFLPKKVSDYIIEKGLYGYEE